MGQWYSNWLETSAFRGFSVRFRVAAFIFQYNNLLKYAKLNLIMENRNGCCALAVNPYNDGRVVHETPNFFVCASLGSMGIPGYLLIVTREHYEGSGELPPDSHGELDELIRLTRARLFETYKKGAVVFEHGPKVGNCGWGGCIDHTHFHVVPGVDITDAFAVNLLDRLEEPGQSYRVDRVEGLKRAAEISEKRKTSYVMLEPEERLRLLAEVNFPGESQWLRKLVAREIGTRNWNWRENPYFETAMRTAEVLQGKF